MANANTAIFAAIYSCADLPLHCSASGLCVCVCYALQRNRFERGAIISNCLSLRACDLYYAFVLLLFFFYQAKSEEAFFYRSRIVGLFKRKCILDSSDIVQCKIR